MGSKFELESERDLEAVVARYLARNRRGRERVAVAADRK
jgi:hypothetical protein